MSHKIVIALDVEAENYETALNTVVKWAAEHRSGNTLEVWPEGSIALTTIPKLPHTGTTIQLERQQIYVSGPGSTGYEDTLIPIYWEEPEPPGQCKCDDCVKWWSKFYKDKDAKSVEKVYTPNNDYSPFDKTDTMGNTPHKDYPVPKCSCAGCLKFWGQATGCATDLDGRI